MRFGLGGLALATLLSLGCGRLKPATTGGPSTEPDASAPANDADTTPPADATTGFDPDTAVPPTGRPLPVDVRAPVRIADARALLVGNGPDACTQQVPASGNGDRWCAFTIAPSGSQLGELWVLDVTRAAKGDFPACDGTDAGCLRLSTKAALGFAALFEGDTLFYGTDSTSLGQDFLGRIFAWRPGWSAGRQVSSDAGLTCIGNLRSAAAACLDDPSGDPATRTSTNVRAGYLSSETGGPLPVFGRYPLRYNVNDWQALLSPDGTLFVLSATDPTMGTKQDLRLVPTNEVGQAPPTLALDDASEWQISNDGQRIYFKRGSDQAGDLYVADFPTGANVTLVDTNVKSFTFLGSGPADRTVEIQKLRPIGGTIELLAAPGSAAPKTIFNYDDFLNGAVVSPDLRYTTWLNDNFRAVVFRNSDLGTCTINKTGPEVYDPSYLAGAGLMFWREPRADLPNSGLRDAFFASPESCAQKTRFARSSDRLNVIGDRGLVYVDELDETMHGTLKYLPATADGSSLDPAGAVRVHEHVGQPLVLVGEGPPLLVYQAVGATPETSGLYVFGPVPF
jgi:hypothetical protein